MTKKCKKCDVEKELCEFNAHRTSKDGLDGRCKSCLNKYYRKNRPRYRRNSIRWHENPENKKKEYNRLRKRFLDNKDHINECKRIWHKKNLEKNRKYLREWTANRRKIDINYQIAYHVRSRISEALRKNKKHKKSEILLGCTFEEYKLYLESKFLPEMTWKDRKKWNIDHIIPCCAFNLIHETEQKQCFHYSNTQPLWKRDNLRKIGADLDTARKRLPFVKFDVEVKYQF